MANRDSAFLWETEALRAVPTPPARGGPNPDSDDWLTLRQASDATGVPVGTLRKWARHDDIPSFLEESGEGPLRMVSLAGILRRADELGREIEIDIELDAEELGEEPDPTSEGHAGAAPPDPEDSATAGIPEGTMLVPLDAWNKMLNQLGNLHEAGQQLAEARERAAKAETEAGFLRERLSEMRLELETKTRSAARDEETGEGPAQGGEPDLSMGGYTKAMARHLYDRWRGRRRRS